jgi:hypothetical protein
VALAEVYQRTGNAEKAGALMKGVLGSAVSSTGTDMFASALGTGIVAQETLNEARQMLSDIGDQFDNGEYDQLRPPAFAAMKLVALGWSRVGWANFLQGQNLEASRFLEAAWLLSESGTVANRLAQVFKKQAQPDKAKHLFALAVAAGGSETKQSREALDQLAGASAEAEVKGAAAELEQMRTKKVAGLTGKTGTAEFKLVFDGSNKPERAEFDSGDTSLKGAEIPLRNLAYAVKFPDVSSIKILRKGKLVCATAGCTITLLPIDKPAQ